MKLDQIKKENIMDDSSVKTITGGGVQGYDWTGNGASGEVNPTNQFMWGGR